MSRRFPAPWREEKVAGGYVVRDANGQALVHIFARSSESEAMQAKMLTMDEARRIAVNVAKLPVWVVSIERPSQARVRGVFPKNQNAMCKSSACDRELRTLGNEPLS